MAATAYEVLQHFLCGPRDEDARQEAQRVHSIMRRQIGSADPLADLRVIGEGIRAELAEAEEAGIADVGLVRQLMRATYANVEGLLAGLAGAR